MGLKAALTGKYHKAIFNSYEYGESMAKYTYKKALENDLENLDSEQQTMIKAQHASLVADLNKVKMMRDLVMDK